MCEASQWDAQADRIIPPGVQGLDRYAYVNNSPMNYVDPSGHVPCDEDGVCYDHGKPQNRSIRRTLPNSQVMQLLGFETEDELNNWRNESTNNEEFYKLLDLAQAGDIIQLNWNNDTNNLMIVQHNDELAFYSIEEKILLSKEELNGFTKGSQSSLQGAGILRHEKGNQYSETDLVFGNVILEDYTLPYGWNRSSNRHGGVVMNPQFSNGDAWGMGGTAIPAIIGCTPGAIAITGSTSCFIGVGTTGILFMSVAMNADQIPTYYDYLPPQ